MIRVIYLYPSIFAELHCARLSEEADLFIIVRVPCLESHPRYLPDKGRGSRPFGTASRHSSHQMLS